MSKILESFKRVTGIMLCISVLFFYSAKAENAEITVSLTLGESIALNVYAPENAEKAEFSLCGKTETVTSYYEEDGRHKFVFSQIGPKMMNEKMNVILYGENGEKIGEKSISVKEYLEKIDTAQDLCEALLDYGSATQIYENYRTDNLANGKTAEETAEKFKKFDFPQTERIIDDAGDLPIRWTGVSAVLKDSVVLRFYSESENGFDGYFACVRIGNSGMKYYNNFVLLSETAGYFEVPLKATEIAKPVTVYFQNDGFEQTDSPILTYGFETYAYNTAKKTQNESLKTLLASVLAYGREAEAFGN